MLGLSPIEAGSRAMLTHKLMNHIVLYNHEDGHKWKGKKKVFITNITYFYSRETNGKASSSRANAKLNCHHLLPSVCSYSKDDP